MKLATTVLILFMAVYCLDDYIFRNTQFAILGVYWLDRDDEHSYGKVRNTILSNEAFTASRVIDYLRQTVAFVISMFILFLIRYFSSNQDD